MRFRLIFIGALCLFLAACGIEVPRDKADYIGEWKGLGMSLTITPDGSVAYERISGGVKKSVNGPLKAFEGDDFVVGVLFFKTRFVVSRPPREENGVWTMVVDDLELTWVRR